MAVVYEVEHTTTYSFCRPVRFGEHRAMFLPRSGYAGRIISHRVITNLPARIHWRSDPLSNSVTVMEFADSGSELTICFRFRGVHFGMKGVEDYPLEPRAEEVPVQLTPDEWMDLGPYLRPHAPDSDAHVAAWAKRFVADDRDQSVDVLQRMMEAFRDDFIYQPRASEGTRSPSETLCLREGTCRDYAWLMIEALRRLGFACRFVSGYLYDEALDGGENGKVGSGATHAWVQVYLPGAGWLSYDPTNRLTSGFDLIPVAIARHPGQAVPLTGIWFGDQGCYQGMSVHVSIRRLASMEDQPPQLDRLRPR